MLNRAIARLVGLCTRFAWVVIALSILLTALSAYYAAERFAINTDITKLISPDLPWRQRELALEKDFPQTYERIVAVVEAPTPELVSAAAAALTERLHGQTNLFRSVQDLQGGTFFQRHGLLFLPLDEVTKNTRLLTQASPLIGTLSSDPSLRGLVQVVSLSLAGVQRKQITLDDLARPLNQASDTLDEVFANRPTNFSWRVLMTGKAASTTDLRRIVDIWPVLDFSELEPGRKPIAAIRQAAADLNLAGVYRANVRLTGPVPISDEEFGSLRENAFLNSAATIAVVLLILWLALRSKRIILAVVLSLIAGLAMTAAFGFLLVEALNPISIAFAVLFVGLGVDFGIQYSVRYRAERHEKDDVHLALVSAGRRVGAPLTLAAAATACGFLSFLPTDYRGLSELGMIAGSGMVIAFLTSITLLPALIERLNPPGEPEPVGFSAFAPIDRFFEKHRIAVVAATGLVVLIGLPLLLNLRFDFDPMNLRNRNTESVATYLDLRKDAASTTGSAEVLAPSLAEARNVAQKLSAIPQVARTTSLENFIPEQQPEKLALIENAKRALTPALRPANPRPKPTDAEAIAALNAGAANLTRVAGQESGPGAEAARRLAGNMTKLAQADPQMRAKAEAAFIEPFKVNLEQLRESLEAKPVSVETLPPELTERWMTKDGRVRVAAISRDNPSDPEALRNFAQAILAVEPNATGEAVGIYESAKTIVDAFLYAGLFALLSISILLYIVLRRFGDVLLTLVPLLLAGVLTLEICVLIDLPMNFANIIALPLLLGVGVAFKIYYVMAWRAGQTNLLQSSLTRAVIFSSFTTAAAFGSLWFSSHPGTSSMGKLLALSLACTMTAAVFFQPALMGKPRKIVKDR